MSQTRSTLPVFLFLLLFLSFVSLHVLPPFSISAGIPGRLCVPACITSSLHLQFNVIVRFYFKHQHLSHKHKNSEIFRIQLEAVVSFKYGIIFNVKAVNLSLCLKKRALETCFFINLHNFNLHNTILICLNAALNMEFEFVAVSKLTVANVSQRCNELSLSEPDFLSCIRTFSDSGPEQHLKPDTVTIQMNVKIMTGLSMAGACQLTS